MKKGSIFYSVFKFKCPQCHEGTFFIAHPYNLKKAGEIEDNCNVCGCKYSKEPGFYYGAMYVSYGLGVAMFVAISLLVYLLIDDPSPMVYIIPIIISLVVFGPLIYALSKIIYANIFIKYKGKPNDK